MRLYLFCVFPNVYIRLTVCVYICGKKCEIKGSEYQEWDQDRFKIFKNLFGTDAGCSTNESKIKVFWTIDEPVIYGYVYK